MNPEVWGAFHDGSIDAIVGAVPGTVELRVDIAYLRAMFEGTGTHFVIRLRGCSKLEYRPYDGPALANPAAIAAAAPEIVSVRAGEPVLLDCEAGVLELTYAAMELFLDTGEPVTSEQLRAAVRRYWDEWDRPARDRHES